MCPSWRHRLESIVSNNLFYFCVRIRCRGKEFIEPLPCNGQYLRHLVAILFVSVFDFIQYTNLTITFSVLYFHPSWYAKIDRFNKWGIALRTFECTLNATAFAFRSFTTHCAKILKRCSFFFETLMRTGHDNEGKWSFLLQCSVFGGL